MRIIRVTYTLSMRGFIKTYCCVVAIMLFFTGIADAAAKIELLDGSSGLSSNFVTAILKDRRGLMWIGTQNGLNIYAGYNFIRPYPELKNEFITHLAYDSILNTIWVGTLRGVYIVQPDQGSVQYVQPDTALGGSEVSALCVVPGEAAYVAYRSGALIKVDNLNSPRLLFRYSRSQKFAQRMATNKQHMLASVSLDTDDGVSVFHVPSRKIENISLPGNSTILNMTWCNDSLLFIASRTHAYLLHTNTKELDVLERLSGRVMEMAFLYGDKLMFVACGSFCGNYYAPDTLLEYNISTGVISQIDGMSDVFFGRQRYYCGSQDAEGIIWIGTNRGMYKILPSRDLFDTVLYDDRIRISTRTIIEEPNGDMYVGSSYGLYCYEAIAGSWTSYQYMDPGTHKIPVAITDMLNDSDYVYIAGYSIPYFFRFNKRSRRFEKILHGNGNSTLSSSFSLFRDSEGIIWIGTSRGLMYYNPATNSLLPHKNNISDIENPTVLDIKEGADSRTLWLATNRGVYHVHKKEGVIMCFNKKSVPALSANEIYVVDEDENGFLWLTTNGGGINVLSPDRTQIRYLNRENNGLSSDIVYGMLWQDDGKCWFSTSNGLSCYNPVENRFSNFYTTDGLCNNDFNYNSYMKGRDGKMYFGSVNGLISFYPQQVNSIEENNARLFVLPVSKWDEQTKTFTTISNLKGDGDKIELQSPSASLVFNLGMTDYADPVHNIFRYRILGLFDDWRSLSGEPVLRLHGIPYGYYTVEIQGITSRGFVASNLLQFVIHVKKPFYSTVWFYLLLAMLSVGLISLFFLFKYRNLKKMQLMRLQISSNLHDEVGSLLTSITMFSDNLRFNGNTGPEKDARLERIAGLSREATITMSDILWSVDARNDMPESLSERIQEYAEELLLPLNIELHVDVGEIHSRQRMPLELRQQLYLIFKEAVNNVVKHAAVTKVGITFRYHDATMFFFCITNNGAFTSRQGVQGQGLKNIHMRARKIGATMFYETKDNAFTLTVRKGVVT